MNNFTKKFTELSKSDTSTAGGKGASLGEMTQAGISVPHGFVVLAHAFDYFLKVTKLEKVIDSILKGVDTNRTYSVEEASLNIQTLILQKEIPGEVREEILKSFKELDTEFVAIRSSATSEDSIDHAWAGQLDSFLNTTESDLLDNVKNCWASLFTPRAIFYRFEKELDRTDISVAVVVQTMVNSEKSGIAFSVHPVSENKNELIIEAGFGLGEAIVSGSVTPDSYVVSKESREIKDITVSTQREGLFRKEGGGNEWRRLDEIGKQQVLTREEILSLSEIVLRIESHYRFPCDIEWAYESGEFYIVQSRPITTLNIEK